MSKIKPYPAYVESSVSWIGQIPSGWSIQPFRHTFRESSEVNGAVPVGKMLSISGYRGIEEKQYEDENRRRTADELETYRVVRPGQLAVNTMWLNYGGLGVSGLTGHVSPAYRAYWISSSFEKRYLHHLMRSGTYIDAYTSRLTGIRPNSLQMSRDNLMAFPIIRPPHEEQVRIANFLDRETAEIDAFIADQEELVGLLAERRAATISHAVTKGLDPTVPMKDSGAVWPDSVPDTWTKCAIRNVFRVLDCKHVTAEFDDDGEYPLVSIREVKGDFVNLANAKRTTKRSFELLIEGGRMPLGDDLIVSRNASVGEVSIVPHGLGAFAMGQDVSLIRDPTGEGRTRYLAYVLKSQLGVDAFQSASIGSTFKRINVDDIKAVTFWMPKTKGEVDEICHHLDEETAEFDAAIADAKEAVLLSRERRAALISAAVTGKIDVREYGAVA